MEIFALSGLINAFMGIGFGSYILLKSYRDKKSWFFFLITFSFAVWSFSYWQWQIAGDATSALFWGRFLAGGSILIPVFFYQWVIAILEKQSHINRIILLASYTIAVFILPFTFTELVVTHVESVALFPYWPKPGILYTTYLFTIYIGLVMYATTLLIIQFIKTRNKNQEEHGRLFYVLLGTFLGFGGGATNFFLWYDINILPVGNIVAGLFPFLYAYSIVKHRLFNLKTITAELLAFFMVIIAVIQIATSKTIVEFSFSSIVLFVTLSLSYLLIKNVYREVEQRERIEILAKDLEKANIKLKELDQLKSEFLSFASHQLRNPLSAVKGYTSLLLEDEYGKMSKEQEGAVKTIFEVTDSLMKMVGDFLDISKIEQGGMKYEKTDIDLKNLVQHVVIELEPAAHERSLVINTHFKNGDYTTRADEVKLKQVIVNIIDNAIKYTPKGSIDVYLEEKGDWLRLSVKDSGVGLEQDDLEKLFAKFTRAKDAHHQNTHGSGLGMYLAKSIVEAHHGHISVTSEGKGKGSTFNIDLKKQVK